MKALRILLTAYGVVAPLPAFVFCVLKGGSMKEDPRFEGDKIIYRS